MNEIWMIERSTRYGEIGNDYFPQQIALHNATLEQARNLAEYMSNYYPGCEFLFVVIGDPEEN